MTPFLLGALCGAFGYVVGLIVGVVIFPHPPPNEEDPYE